MDSPHLDALPRGSSSAEAAGGGDVPSNGAAAVDAQVEGGTAVDAQSEGVDPSPANGALRGSNVLRPPPPDPAESPALPVAAESSEGQVPAPGRRQDSVEVLLDGMDGYRPTRAKTTPQTGGQASAAYHAEHELHAGARFPLPSSDKKVLVVERPITPRAIPVAAAARRAALLAGEGESTFVTRKPLATRIAGALLAGLVVVALLFAFMHARTPAGAADSPVRVEPPAAFARPAPAPSPPSLAEPAPVVTAVAATASASAEAPGIGPVVMPPVPSSPAATASQAADGPPHLHGPLVPSFVHRRHRIGGLVAPAAASASAPAAGGDVGEFRTQF